MYKTVNCLLTIIWIFDILNMPFMEFLDTTLPINGLAWFLIWILIPSTNTKIEYKKKEIE